MATITTVRTGNWSDTSHVTGPWPGGATPTTLPGTADDVVVAKNTTLTIDNTSAAANSISCAIGTTGADVGGILACTTSANWKLTLQNGMTGTATTNPSSTGTYCSSVNLDMSASSYTGEVVLNNANSTTNGTGVFSIPGNYQLKGKARQRWTLTQGALTANSSLSCVVDDATGWAVGDKLVFATTSAYNATPKTDVVTIATITPGAGTTATITWTDGTGTGGAVLNAHAAGCPVGNFTSNLLFRPATANYRASVILAADTNQQSIDSYVDNVLFSAMAPSGYGQNPLAFGSSARSVRHKSLTNCAFWEFGYSGAGNGYGAIMLQYLAGKPLRKRNVFYSSQTFTGNYTVQTVDNAFDLNYGPDEEYAIFRAQNGIQAAAPGQHQIGHKISGLNYNGSYGGGGAASFSNVVDVINCDFWSCLMSPAVLSVVNLTNCRFNSAVFPNATSSDGFDFVVVGSGRATAKDCNFSTNKVIGKISSANNGSALILNKNDDAALQEFFQYQSTSVPAVQRTTTVGEFKNATSGMEFTLNTTTAQPYSIDVLARSGAALKLLVYVKKSTAPNYKGAAYTEPSATLSGLGITPVVATATATSDGAWELLTLDLSAGAAPATDGLLSLTLSAQSATAGAQCWFSGLPLAPFISRCRHFGYMVDETNPARVVDPAISANYATASAYTGMTITWGTPSSISTSANQTFQKLVDYTASQMIDNVGSALPITWAGVAGAPAVFAAGAIDITGDLLNGAGSLTMGSSVLTATGYTYTGGTFTQPATTPAFAGGVLAIAAAGSYTFGLTSCEVEFGAASTAWNLSDSTFAGTIHFSTSTGALAVTVAVPSGTTYTTEGANITVTEPVQSASLVWAGALDGTTVLLYNDSNAGALIDTQTITGLGGYVWNIVLPHADVAVGDSLRLRFGNKAYYAGEIQGEMSATGITFVLTMTLHPVYAGWGLDGATYDQSNGGPYTMDGANLQVDIAAAATTGLKTQLGAWTQYLMTLPAGLDAFYGAWDLLALNQIRQNVAVVDVMIDVPTAGALFTFTDNNVNYYRSDFTFPGNVQAGHGLIAMTYNAEPFVATVTGGNVITGDQASIVAAIFSQAGVTPIQSDMKKTNGVTIKGDGTAADKFRSTLVA